MARSLEVIGERWTLLIVRDAFYGVRRFSDFLAHLAIPRAVLTERLAGLVEVGILARDQQVGSRAEYVMTEKGRDLWPVVHSLITWGDSYCSEHGPRLLFTHQQCGTAIEQGNYCLACGLPVDVTDLMIVPGPGMQTQETSDFVAEALSVPHRMLEPISPRGRAGRRPPKP